VKSEDRPPAIVDVEEAGAEVLRFSHEAMATVFEVRCVHSDPTYAEQAAAACFDLVDSLESELSRFRVNSDVARVNHLGAGESTRVSPSTMECLRLAWEASALTGGGFDPTVGTGRDALALDGDGLAVGARASGVRVDLGGIGKGYAVDRMAELLGEWEIGSALVHGGFSSVLALAPPPGGDGWELTLSTPGDAAGEVLVRFAVRDRALAASGLLKGDHIVDPRTGEPVRRRRAAWVSVPRRDGAWPATLADALSTALMVLDREESERLCRQLPGVEAWVLEEGEGPPSALVHVGAGPA